VRQCGACPGAVGLVWWSVQTCGLTAYSVTATMFVGDDVLDVPRLVCRRCLPKTDAPVRRGCGGCARLSPRFARRDTQGWELPQKRRAHTRLVTNHSGDHRGTRWSVRRTRGIRQRTHLPHNTAQARCGRASPNPGWHPQAVCGNIKPYPSHQRRDRLRPCVRRSGSVRRNHRNTSRGKA
jgi:hypothetical protein